MSLTAVSYEQPGIEWAQLTPAQQAQVARLFTHPHHGPDHYTYAVDAAGQVCGWRYWRPSEACLAMIEHVMTGK